MVHIEEYHNEAAYQPKPKSSKNLEEEKVAEVVKEVKTVKCPQCFKRMGKDELEAHM